MSSIVLGVSGGVAAYKAALRAARVHRGRPRRPRRPHARAPCTSSARPPSRRCRATRSPPTSGPTSPRSRTCASGRTPTSSSSPRPPPTCSPAPRTGRADDLLTATLLTAHCPVVFVPGDAHRDVAAPRHPGERRHPPPSRRGRAAAGGGPAHRARLRSRPAARAGRHRGAGRWSCWTPAPRPSPTTWPGAGSSSAPAAPVSRWTRCATWATARRASRAGRWPGSPRPAAPTSSSSRPTSSCRRRSASAWSRSAPPRSCGRRCSPRPPEADVVVMAAAVADFRPESAAATKLKKGAAGRADAVPLVRNPDVLAELVTKRAPGQLVVGFAAETGDDDGRRPHPRAGQARPQGLRPAGRQRRLGRPGVRPRRQRRRRARRRRGGHRGAAGQQGRRRRRYLDHVAAQLPAGAGLRPSRRPTAAAGAQPVASERRRRAAAPSQPP